MALNEITADIDLDSRYDTLFPLRQALGESVTQFSQRVWQHILALDLLFLQHGHTPLDLDGDFVAAFITGLRPYIQNRLRYFAPTSRLPATFLAIIAESEFEHQMAACP